MAKKVKCFFCRTEVQRAAKEARSVLCSNCVAKLAGSPQAIGKVPARQAPVKVKRVKKVKKAPVIKASTGWGRGWHLKKSFQAPDGAMYSFGKKIN